MIESLNNNNNNSIMNSYTPYGNDTPYDVLSIVEKEKELYDKEYDKYLDKKKRISSLDLETIMNEIQIVIAKSINDISNKNYKDLFAKERYEGIGYLFILIGIIGYLIHIS